MRFTSMIRSRIVLHEQRFFYKFDEMYKRSLCYNVLFIFACHCRNNESEIVNFCSFVIVQNSRQYNERIQTSKIVVIVWQWTNSNIESRRHCLTTKLSFVNKQWNVIVYIKFSNMFSRNYHENRLENCCITQYYCIQREFTSDARSKAKKTNSSISHVTRC